MADFFFFLCQSLLYFSIPFQCFHVLEVCSLVCLQGEQREGRRWGAGVRAERGREARRPHPRELLGHRQEACPLHAEAQPGPPGQEEHGTWNFIDCRTHKN